MIIQSAPSGQPRLAIKMDEHTSLAAQFARAFGNAEFERVEPFDIVVDMVSNHDKGWVDFDRHPKTDPKTGLPFNLVDTPADEITRTSAASPDFNERRHPYGGLLSSMHSWGLYNGRYGISNLVLIDTIPPHERHLADRMLDGEIKRQTRLKGELEKNKATASWVKEEHLLQNYKQLQFFDTLALYFNRTHDGARGVQSFKGVPINAHRDVTVTIRPVAPSKYALAPYPFATDPAEFAFHGRHIKPVPPGTTCDWQTIFAAAPVETETFTLVRG